MLLESLSLSHSLSLCLVRGSVKAETEAIIIIIIAAINLSPLLATCDGGSSQDEPAWRRMGAGKRCLANVK